MTSLRHAKPALLAFFASTLLGLLSALPTNAANDWASDPTHFDVFIETDPPKQNGARIRVDPQDNFPVDVLAGRKVVPTNFSDISGGPHLTDDPGWFMHAGFLVGGEDLGFRARGALRYWNPTTQQWQTHVPNGETVRIFGGVPAHILPALFADPDLLDFWLGGTIWTTAGIQGPPEALIADTPGGGDGSVHSHLDFCIQDASGDCPARVGGNPARGAYLIQLELISNAKVGGSPKYVDSAPVMILLANQLTTAELQQATDSLTQAPPSGQNVPQLPAAGVLIMGGP